MKKRRISRAVSVGGVTVGGGAPVTVQSMTNTDTRDATATLAQVRRLYEAGCDIVRVAVPDSKAADSLHGLLQLLGVERSRLLAGAQADEG